VILGSDNQVCAGSPHVTPFPIFLCPPIHIRTKSSKLRCCVLPYVSSHPRPLRATIQGQVTVVLSTRPEIGHDPSLGAPMPGITAPGWYCWPRASARRAPVTGSQTPKLLPPFIVTLRCAGYFPFALHGECWSNNVSVCKQHQQLQWSLVQYFTSEWLQ